MLGERYPIFSAYLLDRKLSPWSHPSFSFLFSLAPLPSQNRTSRVHIFLEILLTLDSISIQRRTATNVFPTPPTTSSLSKAMTIAAGTTFTPPQAYTRYDRGSGACQGQSEGGDSDAVFLLEEGATLSRVTIGANQAEGVHCLGNAIERSSANASWTIYIIGSCTLDHVYFEVRWGWQSKYYWKWWTFLYPRMSAKMRSLSNKRAGLLISTMVV